MESGGGRRGSGIPAARRVHQHETKDPPANSVSGTGRRRERTVRVSMPSTDGADVSNSETDRGRLGVLSIRLAALAIQRPQAVRSFDNAGSIGRFRCVARCGDIIHSLDGEWAETLYPRCKAGKRSEETTQCDVMMGVGGRDEGWKPRERDPWTREAALLKSPTAEAAEAATRKEEGLINGLA